MILEAFTLEQPILSLNDFSNKTGFYKSSILRQIKTLREAGILPAIPKPDVTAWEQRFIL